MITLKVTEQQADLILNALGHRPFLEVNGLINDLLQQGRNQQPENQIVGALGQTAGHANGAGPAAAVQAQ